MDLVGWLQIPVSGLRLYRAQQGACTWLRMWTFDTMSLTNAYSRVSELCCFQCFASEEDHLLLDDETDRPKRQYLSDGLGVDILEAFVWRKTKHWNQRVVCVCMCVMRRYHISFSCLIGEGVIALVQRTQSYEWRSGQDFSVLTVGESLIFWAPKLCFPWMENFGCVSSDWVQ